MSHIPGLGAFTFPTVANRRSYQLQPKFHERHSFEGCLPCLYKLGGTETGGVSERILAKTLVESHTYTLRAFPHNPSGLAQFWAVWSKCPVSPAVTHVPGIPVDSSAPLYNFDCPVELTEQTGEISFKIYMLATPPDDVRIDKFVRFHSSALGQRIHDRRAFGTGAEFQ